MSGGSAILGYATPAPTQDLCLCDLIQKLPLQQLKSIDDQF